MSQTRHEPTMKEIEAVMDGRLYYYYKITDSIELAAKLYCDELIPVDRYPSDYMQNLKKNLIAAIIDGYNAEEDYQTYQKFSTHSTHSETRKLKWYEYLYAPAIFGAIVAYVVLCYFIF